MSKQHSWMHVRPLTVYSWTALLLITSSSTCAAEASYERTQLSLLLRQLETLERMTEQGSTLPLDPQSRYHFDYSRLLEDLIRVRTGVQHYLTPQRAQPRDAVLILGNYQNEREPGP